MKRRYAVLIGGFALLACLRSGAAENSSAPRPLTFSPPCSFAYADGKPYEQTVSPAVCDSLNKKQPEILTQFSRLPPQKQRSVLEQGLADSLEQTQRDQTSRSATAFQAQDPNTGAGALGATTQKLNSGADARKASGELFENDSHQTSLMTAGTARGISHIGGAEAGDLAGRSYSSIHADGAAQPALPKDNFWVKAVKAKQAGIEDDGVNNLVRADEHSHLAVQNKAAQDVKAAEAWNNGHPADAAWEKAKGYGSWLYHRGAQAADTGIAVKDSVQAGELDVARGDPVAVKKVAIGAAVIAAAPVAVPALAAASTATVATTGLALVSAGGTAMTTVGAIDGGGRMLRAESGKQFAIGAGETALAGTGFFTSSRIAGAGARLAAGAVASQDMAEGTEAAQELYAAADAKAGVLLKRSLASEAQMAEPGSVVAGPGSDTAFRNAAHVSEEFGGEPADWVKKSSSRYYSTDGTGEEFETHWIENTRTGERIQFKTKLNGSATGGSGQ